jgi:hypothetical protein
MSDILEWDTEVAVILSEETDIAVNWPAVVAINLGPVQWSTLVALELAEEVPL